MLNATFSRYRSQPRGEILLTLWRNQVDDREKARARAWPFTSRTALARVLEDDVLPDDSGLHSVLVFWRGGDDQFTPPKTVEAPAGLRATSSDVLDSVTVVIHLLGELGSPSISFITPDRDHGDGTARKDVLDIVLKCVECDSEAAAEEGAGKNRKRGA